MVRGAAALGTSGVAETWGVTVTSSSLAHRPATVRIGLPAPTGAHPVGTHCLHARDTVVRLWYPADRTSVAPPAPYLPAGTAARLVRDLPDLPDDLLTFPTHSGQDAPAAVGPRRPVLLFSPGLGTSAAFHTGLLEELASQGYVVAGIDHPADTEPDHDRLLATRVADVRHVLDHLHTLAAGTNPTAHPNTAGWVGNPIGADPTSGHRPLPTGLARALDLTRVGVFGHSLGSRTAVRVVEGDRRVIAAVALDGNPLGPAVVDRPFLLLGNEAHADDPDWADFHDRLRGPRLRLVVAGARHHDLSDLAVVKHTVDLRGVYPVGPIDGSRALAIQRAYVTAWFDRHLRRRWRPLLRARSDRFPEVSFA